MTPQAPRAPDAFEVLSDPGPAAIAVVRARGPSVADWLRTHLRRAPAVDPGALVPGRVLRGELLDAGEPLDDVLVMVHRAAPDWDVRIGCHGGRGIVQRLGELLTAAGFVEAPAGAAGLWPVSCRIEAEALALLPRMTTLAGARWLLRQSTALPAALRLLLAERSPGRARSGVRALLDRPLIFEWFARPLRVALVGPPNAGKSTLANALADHPASLVSPQPGTTRDWVEIPCEVRGFPVTWLDTAGLRAPADELEAAGIEMTHQVARSADAVVLVLDGSLEQNESAVPMTGPPPACVALNKSDRFEATTQRLAALRAVYDAPVCVVSAERRVGLEALITALLTRLGRADAGLDAPTPFTDRQRGLLAAADDAPDADALVQQLMQCVGEAGGANGGASGVTAALCPGPAAR